jgi:dihydrofolate synthase/folylpolyglutamate synthase
VPDSGVLEGELQRFRNAARPMPSFGLDHIRAALKKLHDPQDSIPTAIHITGTNGKGSTAAFIRAMAEAAGKRVHVFTSPHLIRVNERIRVAGELVSDDVLAAALARVGETGEDLTYFEALTAAAYLLFAEKDADLSIIEVGAGGAGDATNVMDRPAATVVTPISRDHEAMFGVSGLAAIARVKAGIFRSGVPAIVAEQEAITRGVLLEEARTMGAQALLAGRNWTSGWDGGAFVFDGGGLNVRSPWLSLPGQRQAQNAGAACAALQAAGVKFAKPETMSAGLRQAVWPARQQRLGAGPVTAGQPGAVWVDAAHNPGGAAMLAESVLAARSPGGERVAMVVAMQAAKDAAGIFTELDRAADAILICPLPDSGGQEGGPGADPHDLVRTAAGLGIAAEAAPDVLTAIRKARADGADRVIVTGSIYLCGAVLAANGEHVN